MLRKLLDRNWSLRISFQCIIANTFFDNGFQNLGQLIHLFPWLDHLHILLKKMSIVCVENHACYIKYLVLSICFRPLTHILKCSWRYHGCLVFAALLSNQRQIDALFSLYLVITKCTCWETQFLIPWNSLSNYWLLYSMKLPITNYWLLFPKLNYKRLIEILTIFASFNFNVFL